MTVQFFNDLESDRAEVNALSNEMLRLFMVSDCVSEFGSNPTAMSVMQTTGLLSSTALGDVAVESFSFAGPEEAETALALESLQEKIKEKAERWADKILSLVHESIPKVMAMVDKIYTKVTGSLKLLSTKTIDAAKSTTRTIKAHPYATATAVIAAILAVGGILAFTGSTLPMVGAPKESFLVFGKKVKSMTDAIKWPFGKLETTLAENGTVVLKTKVDFTKIDSYLSMNEVSNWTKASSATSGQLHRAVDVVKQGWKHVSARGLSIVGGASKGAVMGVVKGINATGNAVGGAVTKVSGNPMVGQMTGFMVKYVASIAAISYAINAIFFLIDLMKHVVVMGLRYIGHTVQTILGHQTAEA